MSSCVFLFFLVIFFLLPFSKPVKEAIESRGYLYLGFFADDFVLGLFDTFGVCLWTIFGVYYVWGNGGGIGIGISIISITSSGSISIIFSVSSAWTSSCSYISTSVFHLSFTKSSNRDVLFFANGFCFASLTIPFKKL